MIELYRRHPGVLLGTALVIFVPLNVVRYPLVDARWYPVALTLTLVGHLALVAVLRRVPGLDVAPIRPGVAVVGLVVVTGLQIAVGLAVEAVVGRSTFGITFGGFVPSVLLGPAWALLVLGGLAGRRRDAAVSP